MSARRLFLASLTAAGLCGCKVGEDYQRPEVALPAGFASASEPGMPAPASEEPPPRWWERLEDPQLTQLLERARIANFDVRAARARVREARALYDVTRGGAGPQVDAQAGYAWQEASTNVPDGRFASSSPYELFQLGFDAAWELDLFGRNARAIEAAEAGAEAVLEDSRDVLVSLYAELARNYVELRTAQRLHDLTGANLALQQDTLQLVRSRLEAGMTTDFDQARSEGQVSTTQASLPQLDLRARQAALRIAVLLGADSQGVVEELLPSAPIPQAPPVAATGLPSDLLRRRADVRRAERELARASALTAQATAELFPRLSLSAVVGLQADSLGQLFDHDSGTFSVGPNLRAPIFHSGALRANVRAQGARQEEALARYEQSAWVALREVEDALLASDRERTRLESLRVALSSAQRALGLARDLNEQGVADFFEVLEAQSTALEAESAVAQSEGQLCASTIAIYKALGGGWEEESAP